MMTPNRKLAQNTSANPDRKTCLWTVSFCIYLLYFPISMNAHADSHTPRSEDTDIQFYNGISQRNAELRWNIASDTSGSETPNILSELTFDDLSITEIQIGMKVQFTKGKLRNTIIEGNINTGTNKGGTITDSDYDGDYRTEEYSRSESSPDDSTTLNGKLLFGYQVQWNERVFITPMAGYRYSQKHFKMQKGVQILDSRVEALNLGPFTSNLDSTYKAQWHSAVICLDIEYLIQKHRFTFGWEFILSDFYAEANWNLRNDFAHPKSFAHWAQGIGNNAQLQYQYAISPHLSLWVHHQIEGWKAQAGDDVVYFSDGTRAKTQLNEVIWKSNATGAGFSFNF